MRLNYPEVLPISAHRAEIVKAIVENQVVVVVGETGSGKSTQIPKMILEALAQTHQTDPEIADFKIACTQPRRLAAVSIGSWIAQEMGVVLGQEVGYKIRFDDETVAGTEITICTDGILLQEMKGDDLLSRYSAILVDEAHERNLNIDFLLGLIRDIQTRRVARGLEALKILVTSATVDAGKFADFFRELNGESEVPVINVSGRLFPVEIKYNPVTAKEDIYKKIAAMIGEIAGLREQGDVLIFMPGESEIFGTIREIEMLGQKRIKCLPLYSRLTMDEQELIYKDWPGQMKVVIATNIAETSLTVPGIKYVFDPGVARMTDFNFKTGIGSLEIKEISQASAVQRAGRAGRVQAGICIRLYSEEEFEAREKYTKPEIQRSDLSSVVLHMILIGIKDVQHFNFIDAPEPRAFRNAITNLQELGAIDAAMNLTDLGLRMAHLPLEPRISAMLLAAEKYNCVQEIAVIASSLSVKDPFVRPKDEEDEADRAKRVFQRLAMGQSGSYRIMKVRRGKKIVRKKVYDQSDQKILASDLVVFLVVWNKLQSMFTDIERERFCKMNYINHKVFQEIEQIYRQLLDTLKTFAGEEFSRYIPQEGQTDLSVSLNNSEGILKSIASGFIQNLCESAGKQAYKSRNVENIYIHPGSILFNISPAWCVSAEIVETTKLFARNNTAVDPKWFEEIAPQLCQIKKGNIFFDAREGRVMREEEVYFRDMCIVKARLVDVAAKDKTQAQDYFVREALVRRAMARQFPWLNDNEKVVQKLKVYASKLKNGALDLSAGGRLQEWYIGKARAAGIWLTSGKEVNLLLSRKGPEYLKLVVDDFISAGERAELDKLFPQEMYLNGERHEIKYFYDDYRFPEGPVMSFSVQQLIDLDDDKFRAALAGINPDFAPHLVVSGGEPFGAVIAEGDNLDEIRAEVDSWNMKKFWKKIRREEEVKGIRVDEILHYLDGVLKRVEIGHSLFFGAGPNSICYAYSGLRMDGRKVIKTIFESREIAVQSTRQVVRELFLVQVKSNFYFKESEILGLESVAGTAASDLDWPDILSKALWLRLDLEATLSAEDLHDVSKVKEVLEKKRLELSGLKLDLLASAGEAVKLINKLSSSDRKADLEKVIALKSELNIGNI